MSDSAIDAQGIGKAYWINAGRQPQGQLSETLESVLRAPARLVRRGGSRSARERFWALRDVSFKVGQGEALGVVGPNGAGKSTMLKLLSRITAPTEGRIVQRGRVATMLEVGTGFHPELSGRENVFLNGTILGMRRREVQARFDEIVEFSGIERFIDTPVKRYSSGMYVRLAFAVAAHLEPEILLIDEVLAVGDADFQRKSLEKMNSVVHDDGRTIIFVSHNLPAIERVCDRAFLIESGGIAYEGSAREVVKEYLHRHEPTPEGGEVQIAADRRRFGGDRARLVSLALLGSHERPATALTAGRPFSLRARFAVDEPIEDAAIEIGISTSEGWRIATAFSHEAGDPFAMEPGVHEITATFSGGLLPGDYAIDVGLHRAAAVTLDIVERVLSFTVSTGDDTDALRAAMWDASGGFVRGEASWRHAPAEVTVR
jgi:homopolymeric O-antigen transport system ATP-binding protein